MFRLFRSKKYFNMLRLQDSKQNNVGNLNNVRREASKEKGFDEIEPNSKITNIGGLYMGINNFKKSYHPRINMVKDVKDDMITAHSLFWSGGRTVSLS